MKIDPKSLIIGILIGIIIGMFAGKLFGGTPASELKDAVADCAKLPPAERQNVRYLSLYAISEHERDECSSVLGFAVNSLSRTRRITGIHWVTHTLGRISMSDYAPSVEEYKAWYAAWEKCAQADPTWHFQTEIAVVKGKSQTQVVTVDGGWVGLPDAQKLKLYTASNGAILRGDYFIAAALMTPNYYAFAGVPATEGEFVKSLGLQTDVIEKLRANAGANLMISGVTLKPRRVIWQQGPLGGVYSTLDVEKVDAARDPIRRPITSHGLALAYDVSEWFVMAPNGLWRTALYDSKGKLQQSVPDKVAKDTSDPRGDGIVYPLASCIRCHQEGGLRPFEDDQTKLLAKSELQSYEKNLIIRATEFYDEPRLQRQMAFDRDTYAHACKAASGLQPKELAGALTRVFGAYAYEPVTLTSAARECGQDVDEFRAAIVRASDPVLLTLLENRVALRDQWSSSFAEAMTLCVAREKEVVVR